MKVFLDFLERIFGILGFVLLYGTNLFLRNLPKFRSILEFFFSKIQCFSLHNGFKLIDFEEF